MKHNTLFGILITCTAIGLTGCSGKDKKVQSFAEDFGNKASKNQVDSLKILYPTLDADSVALTFNVDSLSITEGKDPNSYILTFGNDVTVNVMESEEGNLTATSSKGLYAFKPEDLKLASGLGMYDSTLNDKELKIRLEEIPAVKEYIIKDFEASNKKDLSFTSSITGPEAGYASIRTLHIKVTNKGNTPVKGSDYYFNCKAYWMEMGEPYSKSFTVSGKDVPVGGTITISGTVIGSGHPTGIVWRNKKVSLDFDKDYTPTGKEYKAYLESKMDSTSKNK